MTQWLPIDTYKYDGTWGLFRGGEFKDFDGLTSPLQPPTAIGMNDYTPPKIGHLILVGLLPVETAPLVYHNPTEWLPLSILDHVIDDSIVNGLRIAL